MTPGNRCVSRGEADGTTAPSRTEQQTGSTSLVARPPRKTRDEPKPPTIAVFGKRVPRDSWGSFFAHFSCHDKVLTFLAIHAIITIDGLSGHVRVPVRTGTLVIGPAPITRNHSVLFFHLLCPRVPGAPRYLVARRRPSRPDLYAR